MPAHDPVTGERATAQHDGSMAQSFLFARQLFAYEVASSELNCDDVVLDLACGTGYGSSRLSRSVRTVTGVDVSADAIRGCRDRYGSERCMFVVADGARLPMLEGAFTAITSFQTIEHIQSDGAFVAELRRVLKPDGRCLISTPNRSNRLRPGQRPWNRFHVREYDAQSLRELLAREFRSVTVRGVHASSRWQEFERHRISRALRIDRWDPLRLRHRVPISAVQMLRRIAAGWLSSNRSNSRSAEVATSEFHIDDRTDDAMDLFAICQ